MGGNIDNYLVALKYYSFSLELSKTKNLSALYGLILTGHTIASIKSSALPKEASDAIEWAKQEITNLYKDNNNNNIVSDCLDKLSPKNSKSLSSGSSSLTGSVPSGKGEKVPIKKDEIKKVVSNKKKGKKRVV